MNTQKKLVYVVIGRRGAYSDAEDYVVAVHRKQVEAEAHTKSARFWAEAHERRTWGAEPVVEKNPYDDHWQDDYYGTDYRVEAGEIR